MTQSVYAKDFLEKNYNFLIEMFVKLFSYKQEIIIGGGSIPSSTSNILRNSHKDIERFEWTILNTIKEQFDKKISFADYSIRHYKSIGEYIPGMKVDVKLYLYNFPWRVIKCKRRKWLSIDNTYLSKNNLNRWL